MNPKRGVYQDRDGHDNTRLSTKETKLASRQIFKSIQDKCKNFSLRLMGLLFIDETVIKQTEILDKIFLLNSMITLIIIVIITTTIIIIIIIMMDIGTGMISKLVLMVSRQRCLQRRNPRVGKPCSVLAAL